MPNHGSPRGPLTCDIQPRALSAHDRLLDVALIDSSDPSRARVWAVLFWGKPDAEPPGVFNLLGFTRQIWYFGTVAARCACANTESISPRNRGGPMRFGEKAITGTLVALALLVVAACNQQSWMQRFASPEDQANARRVIDHLRNGDFEEIERAADSSISSSSLRDTLAKMAALIPKQDPTSVTLIGAHTMHATGGTTKNLTFEYNFSGKWLVLNVATLEKPGRSTIVGLNVYPQTTSVEEQNRFRLGDKTTIQYVALGLAVLFPLLTFYALAVCAKTKLSGRKWPWVLFILLGVGKFAVNWTTGAWGITLVAVQLFSASAAAPFYGPWTVAVSLPLGAIVFLLRRRALLAPSLTNSPTLVA